MVEVRATKLRLERPPSTTKHASSFPFPNRSRQIEVDIRGATLICVSYTSAKLLGAPADGSVLEIQTESAPTVPTRLCFTGDAERSCWVSAFVAVGCVLLTDQSASSLSRVLDPALNLEVSLPPTLPSDLSPRDEGDLGGVASAALEAPHDELAPTATADPATERPSTTPPQEEDRIIPQTADTPPDVIPTRYLINSGGNREEALRRWQNTYNWRKSAGQDDALYQAWPHFDEWKANYLHCFHRKAKNGHTVFYDRLDLKFLSKMVDRYGGDMAVRYYLFITDYCYHELEPDDPGGQQVTVYDLSRVTLSSLLGSCVEPCKQIIRHYAVHYPERANKVFVINAPYFFTGIWTSMKPFLDQRVLDAISISSQGRRDLLDYIGPENVPVCYGGSDETPMGQAPEELKLKAWVHKHNALAKEREEGEAAAAAAAAGGGGAGVDAAAGGAAKNSEGGRGGGATSADNSYPPSSCSSPALSPSRDSSSSSSSSSSKNRGGTTGAAGNLLRRLLRRSSSSSTTTTTSPSDDRKEGCCSDSAGVFESALSSPAPSRRFVRGRGGVGGKSGGGNDDDAEEEEEKEGADECRDGEWEELPWSLSARPTSRPPDSSPALDGKSSGGGGDGNGDGGAVAAPGSTSSSSSRTAAHLGKGLLQADTAMGLALSGGSGSGSGGGNGGGGGGVLHSGRRSSEAKLAGAFKAHAKAGKMSLNAVLVALVALWAYHVFCF